MNNKLKQSANPWTTTNQVGRARNNVLRISLAVLILLIPLDLLYFSLLIPEPSPLMYAVFGVSLLLTTLAALAIWLTRTNSTEFGAFILIATVAIAAVEAAGVIKGSTAILEISTPIVVTLIGSLTLRPRNWGWAILIGAASTVAMVLLDTYSNFERLELPILQTIFPGIAAAIVILIAIFVIREFPNYPLRTKLVFAFLLVALLTLTSMAAIINNLNRVRLVENAGSSLLAETETRALVVGENLAKQLDSLQAFSLSKVIQDRVEAANALYAGNSAANIQAEIQRLDAQWAAAADTDPLIDAVLNNEIASELGEYHDTFAENVEVFVTDKYGANVGATNRTSDYYQADEAWWQAAYNDGKGSAYIDEPAYDESSATYAVIIAIPLYAQDTKNIIGILRTTLEITSITDVLKTAKMGETGKIFLYVAEGKQIPAEGGELIPGDTNALALQLDIPNYADSSYNGVSSLVSRAPIATIDPEEIQIIKNLGWSLVAIQNRDEVLSQIREQNQIITLISILLLGVVAISAFFASQVIARPVQALTVVTERIAGGNLNIRTFIPTTDEIGILGNSINLMADKLRENLLDLEKRVSERTADFEIARHQSENHAAELLAIGEISKIIASEQKLESLLTLITRLVSDRFGFYHTGIFLIDETGQFAVLQAANSEGGKNMLGRAHKLEVGTGGTVGNVAKHGIPRIALDVGTDAVFFNNPDLPNTRSEMALPLKNYDVIIGVLDVQSEKPGEFTEANLRTLGILADQVAIAIQNARLLAQTQQALNEAQALNRENLQRGWATFSRGEEIIGYQQGLTSGKKVMEPIVTKEIRQVMSQGNLLIFNADHETEEPGMVVPIKLRGHTIGAINIKSPRKDGQWTTNEIRLAEAIADRLSLALENARLIQESQRQAIKQQTISEMTGKIGASFNLQNVLQTAVEELGRSMPGSEVIIKFQGAAVAEDPQQGKLP